MSRQRIKPVVWTSEELAKLEIYRTHGTAAAVAATGRTAWAVQSMAKKRGIVFEDPDHWNKDDIERVRRDYSIVGGKALAVMLNRSYTSVKALAKKLHVSYASAGPKAWTEQQDAFLREYYPDHGGDFVAEKLGKAKRVIHQRAHNLGVRWNNPGWFTDEEKQAIRADYAKLGGRACAEKHGRTEAAINYLIRREGWAYENGHYWSEEDEAKLRAGYETRPMKDLCAELNRTRSAITNRAHILGLHRGERKFGDVSCLLDGSPQSLYWIGFLLADGHFSGEHLGLNVSVADRDHVARLAAMLGDYPVHERIAKDERGHPRTMAVLSCYDNIAIPQLMEKFDIRPRKTYEPPNLAGLGLSDHDLTCMLLGFFDGDGNTMKSYPSVRHPEAPLKMRGGRIMLHAAWAPVLEDWRIAVGRFLGVRTTPVSLVQKPHMNTRAITSYTYWGIGVEVMRAFGKFARDNGLPVLERKWWWCPANDGEPEVVSPIPPPIFKIAASAQTSMDGLMGLLHQPAPKRPAKPAQRRSTHLRPVQPDLLETD